MYGGEVTYQKLVEFIKTNCPEIGEFTLNFKDEDGDLLTIASDIDVHTIKEICDNKEIIKIDVLSSGSAQTVTVPEIKQPEQDKVEATQVPQQ